MAGLQEDPLGDLRVLFSGWLQDEAVLATQKGSKAAFQYHKAMDSVRSHASEIKDLKSLRNIKYIGDRTIKQLLEKLHNLCVEKGLEFPKEFESKRKSNAEDVDENTNGKDGVSTASMPPTKKRKKRAYIPARRSGGYSILLALYTKDSERNGLTQEEIIKHATPYCDRSFKANPAANQFYSAWNSVKQLEKHDLLKCNGRPKRYYLTDEGLALAGQLKVAEGIESPSIEDSHSVDITLDNSLMVSSPIQQNRQPSEFVAPPLEHLHDPSNKTYSGVKYELWGATDYDIVLVIDTREVRSQTERDFFQKRLEALGVTCEVEALSVGDGVWLARHKQTGRQVVLNYIFERKRIDDLAFSIRDGRFQEQKVRLKMAAMKHVYYIVEEASGIDQMAVPGESIQTAISMTMTASQFYLRKFKTIEETISFLASVTEVIKEQHESRHKLLVLKPTTLKNQADYEPIIKLFRDKFEAGQLPKYECVYPFETFKVMMAKSMTTVGETFMSMLMCIRGVSLDKAITIQKHFGTPLRLLDYFEDHKHLDIKEKKLLLTNLFKDQVGNKKIGPVVSERIYEMWGYKI
ncbi:crossover junction endonuclease Mus81p [[Candida] anglica]